MNWTIIEVQEIVKDYFLMLSFDIQGIPYNKSQHRRRLKRKLNNRSESSIERKHQNISAILVKYGRPYILGYKPLFNYQRLLEAEVLNFLKGNSLIEEVFESFVNTANLYIPDGVDFSRWLDRPPEPLGLVTDPESIYEPKAPKKINYLQQEQENSELGNLGEKLVLEYEKWRLIQSRKEKLSEKVEWISESDGDGVGFDILSKNEDGSDRFIEVKTTKLGRLTPIYFSKNELDFSQKNQNDYFLYRVFKFNKSPRLFNVKGSLDQICRIEPTSYIGRFG